MKPSPLLQGLYIAMLNAEASPNLNETERHLVLEHALDLMTKEVARQSESATPPPPGAGTLPPSDPPAPQQKLAEEEAARSAWPAQPSAPATE